MKNRTKKRIKNKKQQSAIGMIVILLFMIITYFYSNVDMQQNTNEIYNNNQNQTTVSYGVTDIPQYEGNPYIVTICQILQKKILRQKVLKTTLN